METTDRITSTGRKIALINTIIIIIAEMAVFNVAGYLTEKRQRWPVILLLPHEDNISNKIRILKERHIHYEKTVPVAWLD